MVCFNRLLNLLTLLVAAAVLISTVALYQRRQQLQAQANLLPGSERQVRALADQRDRLTTDLARQRDQLAVAEQRQATMLAAIQSLADQFELVIDPQDLDGLPLLVAAARATRQRDDDYAAWFQALPGVVDAHEFATVADSGNLASLQEELAAVNVKLRRGRAAERELAAAALRNERLAARLDSVSLDAAQLEAELDSCLASRPPAPPTPPAEDPVALRDRNIVGHVVHVNDDWHYVIIDLGRDRLLGNEQMTVARDQSFVCKVVVRRVFDSFAVADVVPSLLQAQVSAGDRVIF